MGPSLFFSLLIITVSFLPVFVLGGESGRLFKPLAMTKTFAMGAASDFVDHDHSGADVLFHHGAGAAEAVGVADAIR